MPSILVETAFITNPAEEKRLSSPSQREKLAGGDPRRRTQLFSRNAPAGKLVCRQLRQGEV